MSTYEQVSAQDAETFVTQTQHGTRTVTLDSILGLDALPAQVMPAPNGFDLVQIVERSDIYAPEVFLWEGGDISVSGDSRWSPVTGFSSQYGYTGPVMHASEHIGGGMAQHIVNTPGIYAAVVVDVFDADYEQADEPAGWMLLHMED
jgi:hypothetical protein